MSKSCKRLRDSGLHVAPTELVGSLMATDL